MTRKKKRIGEYNRQLSRVHKNPPRVVGNAERGLRHREKQAAEHKALEEENSGNSG